MTQAHVEPPPILLIRESHDGKSDKYFMNLKLRRDPTSSTSDLYDFRMSLFDNGDLEEFFLLFCNFNTTLATSGMMDTGAKIQYLHMLVRGEVLGQFDSLSDNVESSETLNVE